MSVDIKKSEEIWTSDHRKLGQAHRLFHRQKDVNPELKLYATYLYVVSFEMGDDFYIPIEYINGREENGRLLLNVSMNKVQDLTWTRLPDFIAKGEAKAEDLPS